MGERSHPWDELRQRDHIRVGFADLEGMEGLYARRDGRAAILLDAQLGRRRRKAVLAHELIHDERGGGCDAQGMPSAWRAVVARDERHVHREVALWLVPRARLVSFMEGRVAATGEPIAAWEVAEEFDVPDDVAERAIRLLGEPFGWGEVVA